MPETLPITPYVPQYITVHLGAPSASAEKVPDRAVVTVLPPPPPERAAVICWRSVSACCSICSCRLRLRFLFLPLYGILDRLHIVFEISI